MLFPPGLPKYRAGLYMALAAIAFAKQKDVLVLASHTRVGLQLEDSGAR